MAEHGVANDFYFSINTVDLSAWVTALSIPEGANSNPNSRMGDTTERSAPGLKTWSGSVDFIADFAAGGPDATIAPIIGTVVAIEWRPKSDAASATNPKRTGSALVTGWDPTGNASVGSEATMHVELASAGDLTRATS